MELSRRALLGAALASAAGAALGPGRAIAAPSGQRVNLADDDTVVYTTSFEDNDPAWITDSTSYDATQARTGSQSLKYTRTDAANYQLAGVSFPVQPGGIYSVTGYVKTADLDGAYNRGARIAIEAYTADGKWISGAYSGNVRAAEWTKATATYAVPETAATLKLSVYIYKGLTGTAWFDDITVGLGRPQVQSSGLLTPSYRGWLIPGDWDSISLRTAVSPAEGTVDDYSVRFVLADASGNTVDQQTFPAAATVDYTYPAAPLAVGPYSLRSQVVANATGEVVGDEAWGLEKLAAAPTTYVDKHQRLIRDGQPFFPLGFYNNNVDELSMQELAGTPFNTILPYSPLDGPRLDLAAANGISVIYSLKDFFYDSTQGAKPKEIVTEQDEVPVIIDRVKQYRDHPAMLAWYMVDEKDFTQYGDRMIKHYDAVVANDSAHPAYEVENRLPDPPGAYMRTTDVYGCDSYPVKGTDGESIAAVSLRASGAADLLPTRAMWQVPQSFAWGSLAGQEGRFPTLDEFRNMTWQFLANGAMGLVYYELYYMRQDPDLTFEQCMGIATDVAQEVSDLVPALLSAEPAPQASTAGGDWLDWLVKRAGDTGHLFAVNHSKGAQSATFTVPAAVSVTVRGEDRTVAVAPDGSFSDDFSALAVHLYDLELVNYDSLNSLTGQYFEDYGAPGQAGTAAAASRLLQQSRDAADQGRPAAADHMLGAYRLMIQGHLNRSLTADQVQTLVRLSDHL
jgi:hypothetical protein